MFQTNPFPSRLRTPFRRVSPFTIVLSAFLLACMASCQYLDKYLDDPHRPMPQGDIVYIENNEPADGQNAILAYVRTDEGKLTKLPGSPFLTKGKGVGNPEQILGPNDSDRPLVISPDRKYLFAANSGSNTIAVFSIQPDGALKHVPGSPFPSGGINPVSVGVAGNKLYVVNKNQDPMQPNPGNPNYTVFTISSNGALSPVPNSTIETVPGGSPSFAYVSKSKKLLFGTDFLAFQAQPPAGTLRAFSIKPDGSLQPAPGTPQAIPGRGGALGLYEHPKANVLYVGFPLQAKVGVYTFDPNTGELTFKNTTDAGAAACWIRLNKDGSRMYTLNTAESTVSVHDASNPEAPTEKQKFALKYPGPRFMAMGMSFTSSQPFYEELSLDEKYLYVVNQHANPDFSIGNFNYLHVLSIAADGTLSEPGEPVQLPVPATTRPQGIAVL